MKQKGLIITTIVFFLIVNTSYFWEGNLGTYDILAYLILVCIYIGLAIAFLRQCFLAEEEKFTNKNRILTIGLLAVVLCLTFLYPVGVINFDKLSGKDLLVAEAEGAGNCTTTFKLKDNNTFTEKSICFGVTKIKGSYKIIHDTIFFENIDLGRYEKSFYKFALIRPSKYSKDQKRFDLVRFKEFGDTAGHELWIIKNDLDKPAEKSRTANSGFGNSGSVQKPDGSL